MSYATLARLIENLIRIGTIEQIDHANRRVRVTSGGLTTGWLKWQAGRAGATRTWDPPTLGEQVMILSPSGVLENGIVIPSIYSDAHDAPDASPDTHVTEYPDDARIVYNHETGHLSATGIQRAEVQAAIEATFDCPLVKMTGNAQIAGNLEVAGGVSVGTDVTAAGDVSASGISLKNHKHGGVVPGGSDTGSPK